MIKFILSLLFMFNIAYANGERYFIKLGSFKNLQGLEKSINRLPYSLRSHLKIIRSHGWFIPLAYNVRNRRNLYRPLSKFKRYFPDAHINHTSYLLREPVVKSYVKRRKKVRTYVPPKRVYAPPVIQRRVVYQPRPPIVVSSPIMEYQNVAISSTDNILPLAPIITTTSTKSKKVVETSSKDNTKYKYFTNKMLSGKHYYLAYKSTDNNPNLLIKVSFKTHRVVYQPIIGNMTMTEANYIVDSKKLYMYANSFTKDGAYSVLESHRTNHFVVSSWVNGKKLNTLRYYYDLNNAKEYLGLATSKGLANILEEGSYDEFFIDDED